MLISINTRQLEVYKTGNGPLNLLMVPGGPGLTYEYLKIIHDLLPERLYTVFSYNPSGTAGNIDAPFYKNIRHYADELKLLLDRLDISSCFILGHSWGNVILIDFLLSYPKYPVKGAIWVSPFASGNQIKQAIKYRMNVLPEEFHQRREELLKEGKGDEYDSLVMEYWVPIFFCRITPLPGKMVKSLMPLFDSPILYYYFGYNFFDLNGAVLLWDRFESLKDISCPVLIMCGEYDYLSHRENKKIAEQLKYGVLWYEKDVSHLPMYEKTDKFIDRIRDFTSTS